MAVLQTIQDLDAEDPVLKGQLSLIQKAMEKYYSTELTTQRHFTVFVSTNSGFRTTNTANVSNILLNRVYQCHNSFCVLELFWKKNLLRFL